VQTLKQGLPVREKNRKGREGGGGVGLQGQYTILTKSSGQLVFSDEAVIFLWPLLF
jgi:hypothetical protein